MLRVPKCARMARDAEKIQGFERAGNTGAGDFVGGRGRTCLWGICGCAAGIVPGDGADVRGHARGGGGASGSADRNVPAEIWRAHPADPAGERERVSATESDLAGAAAGRERGQKASGSDGDGGAALLPEGDHAHDGRIDPGTSE